MTNSANDDRDIALHGNQAENDSAGLLPPYSNHRTSDRLRDHRHFLPLLLIFALALIAAAAFGAFCALHLQAHADSQATDTVGDLFVSPNATDFVQNNTTSPASTQSPSPSPPSIPINPWSSLPSLTLMLRTHSGAFHELLQWVLCYQVFWPRAYTQSQVVFVMDDESALDHALGYLLAASDPRFSVHYEKLPGDGILSREWRSIGYCRQMYSNLYADKHTDADYIAILDADSFFTRPPLPQDLFHPATNLSVMFAYNAVSEWNKGADALIGGSSPGEFMIGLPFLFKRSHLPLMRAHIAARTKTESFEQSWRQMLNAHGDGGYSQFDIIGSYLYQYHRSSYSWHINSCGPACHHQQRSQLQVIDTTDDVFTYDTPTPRYVKHQWKPNNHDSLHLMFIYAGVCAVAGSDLVSECAVGAVGEVSQQEQTGALANLWMEYIIYDYEHEGHEAPWVGGNSSSDAWIERSEQLVQATRAMSLSGSSSTGGALFPSYNVTAQTFTPPQKPIYDSRGFVY